MHEKSKRIFMLVWQVCLFLARYVEKEYDFVLLFSSQQILYVAYLKWHASIC